MTSGRRLPGGERGGPRPGRMAPAARGTEGMVPRHSRPSRPTRPAGLSDRRLHPSWNPPPRAEDADGAVGGAPGREDAAVTEGWARPASWAHEDPAARSSRHGSPASEPRHGAREATTPADDDALTDLLATSPGRPAVPGSGGRRRRPDPEPAGPSGDGLFGLGFGGPDADPDEDRDDRDDRDDRAADDRPGEDGFGVGRRRRRGWVVPAVVVVLVLALGGGLWFARDLVGLVVPPDFDGPGTGSVVVQVGEGDSVSTVAGELAANGVVASARAFGDAAEDDPRGRDVSPGFYALRREMSARGALGALLDPAARLGRMEVRGGTQLDDTAGAGDAAVPGVYALLAKATCAPDGGGTPVCRTPQEIADAAATTDPARLGVPTWALAEVAAVEPRRRLEGLVAPGNYDVRPGATAVEAWSQVLGESTTRLESAGLVTGAATAGMTPYQALVVASIVEKEGIEPDFGKIARVIENRLPVPMRLQMDSTINYPLDRQTLLTTPFDRATPGPYNTYLNLGLPPTPIAAASPEAVRAAVDPDPGGWIYFVKCEPTGASCFAVTPE